MKRKIPGQPGYQIALAAMEERKFKLTPLAGQLPAETLHRFTCDFCGATLETVKDMRLIRCPSCRAYLYPCPFCRSSFDRRGCPVKAGLPCRHDHGESGCHEAVQIVFERKEAED